MKTVNGCFIKQNKRITRRSKEVGDMDGVSEGWGQDEGLWEWGVGAGVRNGGWHRDNGGRNRCG